MTVTAYARPSGKGLYLLANEGRLQIQLLGDLRIVSGSTVRELPPSRKTRALLAYLALNEQPQSRDRLCELLWDGPDDPRAALRWSLSKLRPLLAVNGDCALLADRGSVTLARALLDVDVVEMQTLVAGVTGAASVVLLATEQSLADGYLVNLDDVGSHGFQVWLESERQALRDLHRRLIDELVSRTSTSSTEKLRLAARRIALDPLHDAANIDYLRRTLASSGLSSARKAFDRMLGLYRSERQAEGELRAAWHRMSQLPAANSIADVNDVTASGEAEESGHPVLPDQPSLAILNFSDISSHVGGAVLANGLAVDLNARLAQIPSLFVIARASAARMDAVRQTPREIGKKLGVRYLVSGSTQREDKRVRATVTLIDATEESELWSEHFDRPVDDLFEVQDNIINAVIAAIEPAIERAEMQRALQKPPDSLTAWELFHRGLWHCFRFRPQDNETAHRLFNESITLDPTFARAYAGLSFTHYSRAFLNAAPDIESEISAARDTGLQSVDCDVRDAMGHWALGRALFLSRRHDDALEAISRSLEVNPNYAQGHYARGFVGIHAGIDEASMPALDMAQRLSPFDPLLFAMKSSRGLSLASQGKYDAAAAWAIRATLEPNAHFHIYAVAAACLELAGRSAEARNNARWVLTRRPDYSVKVFRRSFPHKHEARRTALLDALAQAGIPRGD